MHAPTILSNVVLNKPHLVFFYSLFPTVQTVGILGLIFRPDVGDAVLPLEVLQVFFGADQHDLGKMAV